MLNFGNRIFPADFSPSVRTMSPFLAELKQLFKEMDRAYRETAVHFGFECRGCEQSCCLTEFYHHTFLEYFYLREGFQNLTASEQARIAKSARCATLAYADKKASDEAMRTLCPLNADQRCLLYSHRPMICRLHGIPHILHHPVKGAVIGPGCHLFEAGRRGKQGLQFDRTPFYTSLAGLEKRLRRTFNLTGKIQLTVADMIEMIAAEVEP